MIKRRKSKLVQSLLLMTIVAAIIGGIYWFKRPTAIEHDLTGKWILSNQVKASSLKRYVGDTHEFHIWVTHAGDSLHGKGEQTLYNGKTARNHYPLWFTKGEVRDDMVMITYRMRGSREFDGTFTLQIDQKDPTLMRGSFTSEAANTSGTTEVRLVRSL